MSVAQSFIDSNLNEPSRELALGDVGLTGKNAHEVQNSRFIGIAIPQSLQYSDKVHNKLQLGI